MRAITPSKRDGGTWNRKRAYCPVCRRRIAVHKNGNLYDHTTGYIGAGCNGSGLLGRDYAKIRAVDPDPTPAQKAEFDRLDALREDNANWTYLDEDDG